MNSSSFIHSSHQSELRWAQPSEVRGQSSHSGDRFIYPRQTYQMNENMFLQNIESRNTQSAYSKSLAGALFKKQENQRVLSKPGDNSSTILDFIQNIRNENISVQSTIKNKRHISSVPDKILDAPDIEDNYYLNLMDWSSWGQLGICLRNKVYLYTPASIEELHEEDSSATVCSISFHPTEKNAAIGMSDGRIQIFDVEKCIRTSEIYAHEKRISALAFSSLLFSGSRDTMINAYDLRQPNRIVRELVGHMGEVCGLKYSTAGGLVSGSNDNLALVWDIGLGRPKSTLKGHKAAVKALAWCPWQRNLLATGGGTSDQTMRFWNVDTGKCVEKVNTNSQVCSIIWSPKQKQVLTSHGYSENQLCLWKYPDLTKIQEFRGHTQRVLHMALSPDESTVCSASADQTLRFWRIFKEKTLHEEFSEKYFELDAYCHTIR